MNALISYNVRKGFHIEAEAIDMRHEFDEMLAFRVLLTVKTNNVKLAQSLSINEFRSKKFINDNVEQYIDKEIEKLLVQAKKARNEIIKELLDLEF